MNLAAITVQKEATFYSTTMKAETAFAPIIRNSKQIRFLQNTYATLGEIITALLAQRKAEVTFAFDDDNSKSFFELFYLSRWDLQRCTRSLDIFVQLGHERGSRPGSHTFNWLLVCLRLYRRHFKECKGVIENG